MLIMKRVNPENRKSARLKFLTPTRGNSKRRIPGNGWIINSSRSVRNYMSGTSSLSSHALGAQVGSNSIPRMAQLSNLGRQFASSKGRNRADGR